MNKTEVMAISMEMARSGRGLNPADAIDYIAELIAREDPASELHDWRVEKLLATAACIWRLRREQIT